MRNRVVYLLFGTYVGLTIPIGWLAVRAYHTRRVWWLKWLEPEMERNGTFYLVLTLVSVVGLAVIGYLLGERSDERLNRAENAEDENLELTELATTDGLTGLFNARYLQERLDVELENSYRSPLTCLLIDIDHFKKINDRHGHPAGDAVLVQFARILLNSVKRVDIVGRLGGEEFLVILPGTPEDRALIVAERIRASIETADFTFGDLPIPVTASAGLVTYPSNNLSGKESLLKAADTALYDAKKAGRNRIVVWKDRS